MFANNDGQSTATSSIGEGAFVGSNVVVVAPVSVGAGAFLAAGSAITEDVPEGALAIARDRGHISSGWVARHRGQAAPSSDSDPRSDSRDHISTPEEHS